MGGKKKRIPLGETPTSGFHSPFAQLLGGGEAAAAVSPESVPEKPTAGEGTPGDAGAALTAQLQGIGKVVVRRERKGRGGKTVTLLEGLGALGEAGLRLFLTRLRKGLGCGAGVENTEDGPVLVLQGDQGERVEAFLRDEGVRKVVRGS